MRRPEVGIIALAMLAVSCAIPTEAPNWDMTWNLPLATKLNIGLEQGFLPSGITIDSSGTPFVRTGFTAVVSSVPPISRTLGAQCPSCPTGTAQKPAFTAPASTTTISLTSGTSLTSAVLTTPSAVAISINNGFTFDPINPPGAPGSPGTVTLTVSNGAATLGTLTLQGGTAVIPAGQTSAFSIPLAGTINTSSPITVTMTMVSPAGAAGSPVAMSPTQAFVATATPVIKISSAVVTLAAQPITAKPDTMNLADLDSAIVNRITDDAATRGSLILAVTNPLTLGANATVSMVVVNNGITTTITKPASIPAAPSASVPSVSTVKVDLTGTELRRLLGNLVVVKFGGATAAGSTTVTAAMFVRATTRMVINLNLQEQK